MAISVEFENIVTRFPQHLAVVQGERQLTYQQLMEHVATLGQGILEQGADNPIVLTLLGQDVNLVTAALAVRHAGRTFVPLSPQLPEKRLAMLAGRFPDATLITSRRQLPKVAALGQAHRVVLVDEDGVPEQLPQGYLRQPIEQPHAYVYFTSGSTGTPKAVLGRDESLLHFIHWESRALAVTSQDRVSQLTPQMFDPFLRDLFLPLLNGATLCLPPSSELIYDAPRLLNWIREQRVSVMHLIPSLFQVLLESPTASPALAQVRCVALAGEMLKGALVRRFADCRLPDTRLFNFYGPTESTLAKVCYPVAPTDVDRAVLPVGQPIDDTRLLIVNKQLQPLSQGVVGEVLIVTPWLSAGYLEGDNRNFITLNSGESAYRTGDLGMIDADGNLILAGRNDTQIKIDGQRVETGEIEGVLERHEQVRQALVMVAATPQGARLQAFVVAHPQSDLRQETLRDWLSHYLPATWVPTHLHILDLFPRLPNGKVDRKALQALYPLAAARPLTGAAPQDERERALAAIWQSVLQLDAISRDEDFFQLNGSSLQAIRMIARVREEMGLELAFNDLYQGATLAQCAAALREPAPDVQADHDASVTLSVEQQGLWLIQQSQPDSAVYNMAYHAPWQGPLNLAVLEQVWQLALQRFDTLRTTFFAQDGEPQARVEPSAELRLEFVDLSAQGGDAAERWLAEAAARPFAAFQAPLLRVSCLQLREQHYHIGVVMHHIIADEDSVQRLWQWVLHSYRRLMAGGQADAVAPAQGGQYGYARQQHRWLHSDAGKQARDYWQQQLTGPLPLLQLPYDYPAQSVQHYHGGHVPFSLSSLQSTALLNVSRQYRVTPYLCLMTLYSAFLSRYCRQSDILLGTPVSRHHQVAQDNPFGLLFSVMAMRHQVDKRHPFAVLLEQVRSRFVEALQHPLPFNLLPALREEARTPGISPLFQAFFVWREAALADQRIGAASVSPLHPYPMPTAKYELTLEMWPDGQRIQGSFEYASDRLAPATVARLAASFYRFIESFLEQPESALGALPLLTDADHQQLLRWNQTARPFDDRLCWHQLIEQQAQRTPALIALEFGSQTLTYQELNQRANQLAHLLVAQGVGAEVTVGISLERSPWLMVAILAVMKAGGAYVPLDPDYPLNRSRYVIDDAGLHLLLTQRKFVEHYQDVPCQRLLLDDLEPVLPQLSVDNPVNRCDAYNTAYIIYTSGSTGQPKGVPIRHHGVSNLALEFPALMDIGAGDRVLQFASTSFDSSVWEISMALCHGATLVMAPRLALMPGPDLLEQLTCLNISYVTLPASALAALPYAPLPALKVLIVAGEACGVDLLRKWGRGRRFLNSYGPTEATVCVTNAELSPDEGRIHIGSPMSNTEVWILDELQQPMPIGVAGELCIGGIGLSDGYVNQPEQTASRFIVHPLSDKAGARLYRTGDLACYREDGTLDYLGRIDHQVKIRGFRVELGEIESALRQHPAVKEAVVMVRPDYLAASALIAYVLHDDGREPDLSALTDALSARLPSFMCPSCYVLMTAFPHLPNGKIDRNRFPLPEQRDAPAVTPAASDDEQAIIDVWRELLGHDAIGRDTSFFAAGGHSLLAAKAVAWLAERHHINLRVSDIFTWRTPMQLAANASRQARESLLLAEPAPTSLPLSSAQQRMWFLSQQVTGDNSYLIGQIKTFSQPVEASRLLLSLQQLWAQVPVLNTRLRLQQGVAEQYLSDEPLACAREHWSPGDRSAWREALQQYAERFLAQPFDMLDGPLYRLTLVESAQGDVALVLVLHHILADEQSMSLLDERLLALYQQQPIAPAAVNYLQYTAWEQREDVQRHWQSQLNYWQQQFATLPPALNLAPAALAGDNQRSAGYVTVAMPAALTGALRHLAKQRDTTLFNLLLAAFQIVLHRHSGEQDVVIGTPVTLRDWPSLQSTIGLLLNTVAIRQTVDGEQTLEQFMDASAQVCALALANKDVPFDRVVDAVLPAGERPSSPLFQVMFVYNAAQDKAAGLAIDNQPIDTPQAKFDLTCFVRDDEQQCQLVLEYRVACFNAARIRALADHYLAVLQQLVDTSSHTIGRLPMLPPSEQALLRNTLNDTAQTVDAPWVHQQFERQAALRPTAVALRVGDHAISYQQLNQQANRIAHALLRRGFGVGSRVAVYLPRSPALAAAILGVMKSGAAWVPVDVRYPADRASLMMQTAEVQAVLTQHDVDIAALTLPAEATVLDVAALPPDDDATNPLLEIDGEQLCYILFTSGSTGVPKGVMIPHRGLRHYLDHACRDYSRRGGQGSTLHASISFDATLTSLFLPLLCGQTLHILPDEEDIGALVDLWRRTPGLTMVKITPAHLELLSQQLPADAAGHAAMLVVGGESLSASALRFWQQHAPQVLIVNEYGPTEATVGCCIHTFAAGETGADGAVPIGRPIANTRLYLLDAQRQLVPFGAPGELYIGGDGVALGYYQRPDLTEQRFIADPFSTDPAARLYRTGDRACYLPDGNLCFLGRNDNQVKLNGYRIELEEVEAQLSACAGVAQAAVAIREVEGRLHLVAWLVGDSTQQAAIRGEVARRLPRFMRPTQWQWLESLPLTSNGKVHRQQLQRLPWQLAARERHQAPTSALEQQLLTIWQQVLGRDDISTQDDFFALGGDSILSLQIVFRAREAGLALSVDMLFDAPTIAALAEILTPRQALVADTAPVTGAYDLLPVQRWFFAHHAERPHHYNQSMLWRLRDDVAPAHLQTALTWLVNQHDGLRARFDGAQAVMGEPVEQVELTLVTLDDAGQLDAAAAAAQEGLDIAQGPLFKTLLYRAPQGVWLLFVAHHLLVDGVSWRIITEDLSQVYLRLAQGQAVPETAKTASLPRWSQHLHQYAHSDAARQEDAFWQRYPALSEVRLPCDTAPQATPGRGEDARKLALSLPESTTSALVQHTHAAYRTNPGDLLLTALALTLQEWSGQSRLRIDTEGHGREQLHEALDVSRTVGWFTAIYPLHIELDRPDDTGWTIRQVKEAVRQVPHRGAGYGIRLAAASQVHDAADICFNYLGQFTQGFDAPPFQGEARLDLANRYAPQSSRVWPLEVDSYVLDGKLHLEWTWNSQCYRDATIRQLAERMLTWVRQLSQHCQQQTTTHWTPSDFPLAELSVAALDTLQQRIGDIEDIYPLTPMQEGMLFHSLTGDAYHEQICFDLPAGADIAALRQAWQRVIQHYPALRTTFELHSGGEPLQVVRRHLPMAWNTVMLNQADARQQVLDTDRAHRFDLQQGPLLRLTLIDIGQARQQLLVSHHHAILDGWSVRVVMDAVARCWDNPDTVLPPPPSFRRYVRQVRQRNPQRDAYWATQARRMSRTPLPLGLPLRQASERKQVLPFTLDAATTRRLSDFARREQLTVSTLVQGAWARLLQACAGGETVLFGMTISGRQAALAGMEQMAGLLINTVPTVIDVPADRSISAWLRDVQQQQRQNERHGDVALTDIKSAAGLNSSDALFDTLLVFENYPGAGEQEARLFRFAEAHECTNYALTLVASLHECLHGQLVYDDGLYDDATVRQLAQGLVRILTQLDDAATLAEVSALTDAQRAGLLTQWQGPAQPVGATNVYTRFVERVQYAPYAIAVVDGETQLNYRQLRQRAEQLAMRLHHAGVRAGDRVVVWLPRSVDYLSAILAVNRLGACYIPVDSQWPDERVGWLLQDCDGRALITDATLRARLTPPASVTVLDVTQCPSAEEMAVTLPGEPSADTLAYIIYTSGSTGTPKGVMIDHASLGNYLQDAMARYRIDADTDSLFHSSISFDATLTSLYLPLLAGGCIYIIREDGDIAALQQAIRASGERVLLKITPVHLNLLENQLTADDKRRVSALVVGGEALNSAAVQRWLDDAPDSAIFNEYGPTETVVGCCVHRVTARELQHGGSVAIGLPIGNTHLLILDEQQQPVPQGAAGELYIGGAGVARGYWNRASLTDERFLELTTPNGRARFYRTGDRVCADTTGTLHYLGRCDRQIKLRGYRIEPGEIEAQLLLHPQVMLSAVQYLPQQEALAAWVALREGAAVDEPALRRFLASRLPTHMVPGSIQVLATMPQTANGKVDYRALPTPQWDTQTEGAAPQTPLEQSLRDIWREVLKHDRIGCDQNFFALGGHSLHALRIAARIEQQLALRVSLTDLLQYQTIQQLAEKINAADTAPGTVTSAIKRVARVRRSDSSSTAV
ncbi:amino acid adenylation domain-containing protein [Dickeya dadantii]|uniref:non-ribosomal peptide synthetase n=1 Tax=Dickeya dadantii TaxID=204038 RepID=UPI001CF452E0|nr:non-ribosomal peptide synthetase [Dickeya dadantii]MCA7013924.1 amino acid adenylation domain-containing protein [Dickeya dadantii]